MSDQPSSTGQPLPDGSSHPSHGRSQTPYWHPFANMASVSRSEFVVVSGRGCEVTDNSGRTYLDATAALWFCNVGYGRSEIVDAVARQLTRLPAYSTFGPYTTDTTLEAAGEIARRAPFPDAAVFLTSGGSDAVETAAKLVRSYWSAMGQPHRRDHFGRSCRGHCGSCGRTPGMAADRRSHRRGSGSRSVRNLGNPLARAFRLRQVRGYGTDCSR